ncbi:MAG: hypothetical protein Q4B09_05455, partial [Lachnospiraceae bacterium]|nr:hypothetical protein [Lachnospiraceae bacterium]
MGVLTNSGLAKFWEIITGKLNAKADKYIAHNSYEGIIAKSNTQEAATFYYAKVIPDDYFTSWSIKVRYRVKINDASTHADK